MSRLWKTGNLICSKRLIHSSSHKTSVSCQSLKNRIRTARTRSARPTPEACVRSAITATVATRSGPPNVSTKMHRTTPRASVSSATFHSIIRTVSKSAFKRNRTVACH